MLTQEQKQRILELAWDLARTNILHERYGIGEKNPHWKEYEMQRHLQQIRQAKSDLKAYLDQVPEMQH